MEPNSPKKIQFAVPLFQSQIDPEAAEQVRTVSSFCLYLREWGVWRQDIEC
ncbi:hypothetical protein CIB84_005263 [Bambusicola thoracicus]|uniref:Uncharacterized protein n=1 Tax=Bambusicola thoracicus TaxID=9083 RepID=A0A2P4T3P4_BAMTH|nr:hypothetical protein CIB84_005263 [Bambusicola thoracicus]